MRVTRILVVCLSLQACGGGEDAAPVAAVSPAPPSSPPSTQSACPAGIPAGDLLPSAISAPACAASNYDLHTDVVYGSDARHLLDLLIPRNASAAMPLVVWVHGGGWQSGSKANRAQSERLACRGYAVASINYRLSSTAVFPAQIHDVKAAIRFLRANAPAYNLDPARIAVMGSSAGGHLAALAGTSQGVPGLEDPLLGNASVSSRVQAVVDWYGPTRLTEMDSQLMAQGCPAGSAHHNDADSAESRLLGCTVSAADCAAQARLADPATHADRSDPPMLLLHGTQDCVSPTQQSIVLAESLATVQACAVMRRVPGAEHGGPEWQSPEVQDATSGFLDRVLSAPR